MRNYHREIVESIFRFKSLHFDEIIPKDVTGAECRTMMKLHRLEMETADGHVTVSNLAKSMDVSVQGLSRTLKHLETAGYVLKFAGEKDRRTHFAALTPKGQEKLAEMDRAMMSVSASVYERLGEDRVLEFLRFIDDLYAITSEEVEKRKCEDE